jgi:hypothetical protein
MEDKCHRVDADGTQYWYLNGKYHRDNDLPAVIYANGDQYWCQNGKCHRDNNLPAFIGVNGDQEWYRNDVRHRDDGPAVIRADGLKRWYVDGVFIKETKKYITKVKSANI